MRENKRANYLNKEEYYGKFYAERQYYQKINNYFIYHSQLKIYKLLFFLILTKDYETILNFFIK